MEVAIAGANGFVGSALTRHFESHGHSVRRIVRGKPGSPQCFRWDPAKGTIDPRGVDGADAVINVSGANLASGRWTETRMREIRDSRVLGTKLIADTIAAAKTRPAVFVNVSGAGFYGTHPEGWVDESAPRGDGFLAGVCEEWEGATAPAASAGTRVVLLRMGFVVAPDGGPLEKMLPVFRLGLGGPIGDGSMWLSWISIVDLVRVYEQALTDERWTGAINAVSPNPCTNKELATELGRAIGRPAAIRTPVAAVRMAFGKLADETILASARVRPEKLLTLGFEFRHPTITDALKPLAKS